MSVFLIYGLVDPRDGQLRYVGQTTQVLEKRVAQHVRRAAWGPHYRDRWLRELERAPEMVELERWCARADADEAERFFISYFRSLGCRLTNIAEGGEGGATRWGPHTVQTRAKMSAAMMGKQKGQPKSIETRARMSAAGKGRAHPWVLRRSRPVVDETGRLFASRQEAARILGVDVGSVSRSIRLGWAVDGHRFGEVA